MVKEYINYMYEYLENQNFWQLHSQLISKKQLDVELAERDDKILTDASLVAESKCKFGQEKLWSVPLAKAKFKLYTLKTHLSPLKCSITATTQTTKYGVTIECPPDIKTTQKQLSKIQKEIKTIIQNSKDKRVEYNKTIASINAITGKTTKEKALEAIVNAEKMSKVWNKIGHVDKKYESGSIASLQIPVTRPSSDCNKNQIWSLDYPKEVHHWRTVETPREIAFYLILRNKLHFGQAIGTPFTIPLLEEELDWAANSRYSEMVLDGTYSNSELSFLEQKLLDHCKKKEMQASLAKKYV
jgi:phosphopantetheine adenylyltransferase